MSAAASLIEAALALPERDRAELAMKLLESLEGEPDEGAEDAWGDVIADRVDELQAGSVQPISSDEAFARAEERLRARRRG